MAVILDLLRRVEPDARLERLLRAVGPSSGDVDLLRGAVPQSRDGVRLGAVQAQRVCILAVKEVQRQHAHADQVGPVDAFEAAADHRLDAQQLRALGGPIA